TFGLRRPPATLRRWPPLAPARRAVVPGGAGADVLRRCAPAGPPVRATRRGGFLLPAQPAGPAGMGGRALAALGPGVERRHAPAGSADDRGVLPRHARLLRALVPVGRAALRHRARPDRQRGDGVAAPPLASLGGRGYDRVAGVWVRGAGAEPDVQRDLPG